MNVSFSPPDISELEIEAVTEALRSGWITTGPKTKEFEKDFRRLRMAESLRQARLLREETNRAAAYLMTAREGERRAAFEKHKDSLRTALYAGVEARRRAAADSMMYPFKHMKPGFGRQD